ncbi:MAG TPA: hypothetical protein VFF69_13250 [Phycisphaerales bacterium]|nr:hypothetical protein [Phycisphaerales bacterium]
MGLIYCGIDEAGYGPMLGPMCVGFSAIRLAEWDPAAGAPDLWKLLSRAVCRDGGDKRRRIAVADSKKLKLSNQLKTKHPLTHLERGVMAFAGLVSETARERDSETEGEGIEALRHRGIEAAVETDSALFAALGVRLEPHGWYGGEEIGLPLGCTGKQIAIARNKLALACDGAGVEPVALACIAVGEREFNEVVRTGGSKGHVTGHCFARYLRRVVERWGAGPDEVRVVCDSHGGRTCYAGMIEAAVRGMGFEIETLEESERCSRYRVGERVAVLFRPEAEDAHLPVALASMTAKLVRELAMARFNRYWCMRMPDLKPTAGYTLDARRWLEEANGIVRQEEREVMVRMA